MFTPKYKLTDILYTPETISIERCLLTSSILTQYLCNQYKNLTDKVVQDTSLLITSTQTTNRIPYNCYLEPGNPSRTSTKHELTLKYGF